jgi:hypothetical protein
MLSVTNKPIMLSVIVLSVFMLSVTNKPNILSVFMLNVVVRSSFHSQVQTLQWNSAE